MSTKQRLRKSAKDIKSALPMNSPLNANNPNISYSAPQVGNDAYTNPKYVKDESMEILNEGLQKGIMDTFNSINKANQNSPMDFKGWGDQATTSIDQHSGMRVRPRAVTQIPYGELGMPMESTLSKADNMRMRGFQDPNDTTNFEDNRIASRGNFKGGMQTINDNNVGQVPPAINPDTYNQPLIPTEGQMTMANLQTPVGQVGAVGNEALWKGPVGA